MDHKRKECNQVFNLSKVHCSTFLIVTAFEVNDTKLYLQNENKRKTFSMCLHGSDTIHYNKTPNLGFPLKTLEKFSD